ncbi:MAG TPA: nitrilase-related carbon-nitrogen hydrolase [Acidobacteriota bacterium]
MRIALIQQVASQDRNENVARGIESLREARRGGAELVVFPELSFLRFFPQHRKCEQPVSDPT